MNAGCGRPLKPLLSGLLVAFAALIAVAVAAETAPDGDVLRVGTSRDYAPFSFADDPRAEPRGFDVALVSAYAKERGLALEWVAFRWPELVAGLSAGRYDFAASGITVRPERSAAGRFTVPVAENGAVLLALTPERWLGVEAFDRPAVRIGVNAGGHLERVAETLFPRATRLAIPDNAAVLEALRNESVHAVLTDSLEAPHWITQVEQEVATFGPLTRDRKAWLVRPDLAERARDLDRWLLAREADGTLARLRAEHFGVEAAPASAAALAALLAGVDERLALMPIVGVVKRRTGVPLEVPEREALVLDTAVASVEAAAAEEEAEAPDPARVRTLFRAQMEASKQVQWRAVKDKSFQPEEPLPDLHDALRPALLRIGDRIARLILALPPGLEVESVRAASEQALRSRWLAPDKRRAIADAIAASSRTRFKARGSASQITTE